MLTHLSIRNFATVGHLELDPVPGLTVVTGETGAGKSVILTALSLALGDRADSQLIRGNCERAEVQACFDISQIANARHWLTERELDDGNDCLLRRTLSRDGRSRAYINGSQVPVQSLRELADALISLHSQHEHQALLKRDAQRDLLDSYAGAENLLQKVATAWKDWQSAREAHNQALADASSRQEREELLRLQQEELDALAPRENELAHLETEQKRLANAESLIQLCQQSLNSLFDADDNNINDRLGKTCRWLEQASSEDRQLENVLNSLDSARLQIEAAADDLRHYLDNLDLDPQRLSEIETRLSQFHQLARKYRIRPDELRQHHQQVSLQYQQLGQVDEQLSRLEQQEQACAQDYEKKAEKLSTLRRKAARKLASGVRSRLNQLGMNGARLEVSLTTMTPGPKGTEQVEFLLSANPGQPLRPLAKTASGGELSRISLAIQVICAQSLTLPCLVFDEVDVGVSGGIAEIVGRMLRDLGQHAQVLCITHQPQVAALGDHHWHVIKQQQRNTTSTEIQVLDKEQRVEEMARLLGGVEITDSTLGHARDMLTRSQA